ncbi:cytochrome P450 [Gonapodya prolifera JEL478]|uniref:Cytochrome P450 n=1 Tax=Gonapodya prolifera (strain JEL478) TaxID=1344416 RepID=A0A139B0K1_GONPJ|nr:cytochrome P450 [Gonapodya prolifera JEL478]|eukprot:KXS22521.1 cytochrome P450 [Gonapodya prolifera JEL478]
MDLEIAGYIGLIILVLFVFYRMAIFVLLFLINPLGELDAGGASYIAPFASNHYNSATGKLHLSENPLHESCGSAVRLAEDLASFADPQVTYKLLKIDDIQKSKNSYAHLALQGNDNNILTTTDKTLHARLKSLIAPAFTPKSIGDLEPLMFNVWSTFEAKVKQMGSEASDGWAVVDMDTYSVNISLDIFGETILGSSLGLLEKGQHPLVNAQQQIFNSVIAKTFWPYLGFFNRGEPTDKAEQTQLRILTQAVDDRVALNKNGERRNDILQTFIDHKDSATGDKLTEDEVVSTLAALNVAGGETTGGALSWALYYLVKSSRAMDRLRAELDEAFPQGLDKQMDVASLKSLRFLDAVIRETLRMRPPVTAIAREISKDAWMSLRDVDGQPRKLLIPGGAHVQMSLCALHRSSRLWKGSGEFIPERWLDGEGGGPDEYERSKAEVEAAIWTKPKPTNRGAYLPFSEGSRDCIGKLYALNVLRICIAHLVRRFDIAFKADPQTPDEALGLAFVAQRIGEKGVLDLKLRPRTLSIK